MLSRSFSPFILAQNFYGVNAKDTPDNFLLGEWDPVSINIFSEPRGSFASRPGFTGLTTASIGSATAWCGFYEFRKSSKVSYYIGGGADGKLYAYASNSYVELASGLGASDDDDRFRFFQLDDICVILDGVNVPMKYTGTGSASSLGGTIATADFGLEWQRYGWLHSTLDPRLMYYCTTLGSVESGYTSFLNFDDDPYEVIGACKQADDMAVFKQWSIFRVKYTGSEPKFQKYRIPSKVGAVSHDVIKELPDGRLMFLAPDFQVYMMTGDELLPVGSNVRKLLKDGVNSRIKYATAGLLLNRSQYWLSYTYSSSNTTNDKTLVMDWSRPYKDIWGNIQFPWFVYSIASNCFAEVYVSGKAWLYHGGYVGKIYRNYTGTNDDGSAFSSTYKSGIISHGDTSLEKKYSKLLMSYERKGSHYLDISIICDDNANTAKNIQEIMSGGYGYNTLWDVGLWDTDYWSSEDDNAIGRDIDRTGKVIQIIMGTDAVDEAFNVYSYNLLAKALRRGVIRSREST